MRTQSNKHLLSLTILLSLTTIVFCYGPQRVSLSPSGRMVVSGTEIRMSIIHSIRYYAMPVLANQDSMVDPVFTFYDRTNEDGRVLNCPFYRPYDGYQDSSWTDGNCYRMVWDSLTNSLVFRKHWGLDIHTPEGTPVVAADTGMVTYAGPFKRGNMGIPDTLIEYTYIFENYGCIEHFRTLNRVYLTDRHDIDWSDRYGNIVLVYYPYWNKTIQYSHLQNFGPSDPYYQNIINSENYIEDPVWAWFYIGNVGRTGYSAGDDTARIHVDVMVYKGKRKLCVDCGNERLPDKYQKRHGKNIEDPYPWLYYKSIKGTMYFESKVHEVVTTDTIRIGNMEPFSPIQERQSGRIAGYLTRYWYDEHPASYSGYRGYHYLFSTVGLHALQAYLGGHKDEILLSSKQNWNVIPSLSKLAFTLERESKPKSYFQISPNPFNSICRITGSADFLDPNRKDSYSIAPTAVVYDIKGQKVSQIEIENTGASYKIDWDGTDQSGQQLPSGAYFIRFIVNEKPQTAKVTLLR